MTTDRSRISRQRTSSFLSFTDTRMLSPARNARLLIVARRRWGVPEIMESSSPSYCTCRSGGTTQLVATCDLDSALVPFCAGIGVGADGCAAAGGRVAPGLLGFTVDTGTSGLNGTSTWAGVQTG